MFGAWFKMNCTRFFFRKSKQDVVLTFVFDVHFYNCLQNTKSFCQILINCVITFLVAPQSFARSRIQVAPNPTIVKRGGSGTR